MTLIELKELRDEVKAAYRKTLLAQEYGEAGRNLRRADLKQLFSQLKALDNQITALENSRGVTVRQFIPRDT